MTAKPLLVVSTGAGISAESGISTFRDADGLWENYNVMDVASADGFARNPAPHPRLLQPAPPCLADVAPNDAHLALKRLEDIFDVYVITQNVDDLPRARRLVQHHPPPRRASQKSAPSTTKASSTSSTTPPRLRPTPASTATACVPHIVFFQEAVPMFEKATEIAARADIFVIIGTSLQAHPAAALSTRPPRHARLLHRPPSGTCTGQRNRHSRHRNRRNARARTHPPRKIRLIFTAFNHLCHARKRKRPGYCRTRSQGRRRRPAGGACSWSVSSTPKKCRPPSSNITPRYVDPDCRQARDELVHQFLIHVITPDSNGNWRLRNIKADANLEGYLYRMALNFLSDRHEMLRRRGELDVDFQEPRVKAPQEDGGGRRRKKKSHPTTAPIPIISENPVDPPDLVVTRGHVMIYDDGDRRRMAIVEILNAAAKLSARERYILTTKLLAKLVSFQRRSPPCGRQHQCRTPPRLRRRQEQHVRIL